MGIHIRTRAVSWCSRARAAPQKSRKAQGPSTARADSQASQPATLGMTDVRIVFRQPTARTLEVTAQEVIAAEVVVAAAVAAAAVAAVACAAAPAAAVREFLRRLVAARQAGQFQAGQCQEYRVGGRLVREAPGAVADRPGRRRAALRVESQSRPRRHRAALPARWT